MIVVIQCAGSKQPDAGHLKTRDGRPVDFVGHPELKRPEVGRVSARPDDDSDQGGTWRDLLIEYNEDPGTNPLRLYRAFELYKNNIYRSLAIRFGHENCYVLSAGWGLVRFDYLLPQYDITFSKKADPFARRRERDNFADFSKMSADTDEPVYFFGSGDYLPLFVRLTKSVTSPRTVFFNSRIPPAEDGVSLVRFVTRTRTNWHYECANAFLDGTIDIQN